MREISAHEAGVEEIKFGEQMWLSGSVEGMVFAKFNRKTEVAFVFTKTICFIFCFK